ncbi:MAG: site-specific integrase [Bacillota bacterium]|nr:site-specific integrase [Bacillota bacterium]
MNFIDLYEILRTKNMASKSINNIQKLLHSILADAVRWELLEYNTLDKVKAPKYKSRKDNFLSIDEAKTLLKLLDNKNVKLKYKTAIYLGLFCGLRNGEVMGLEWKDFDFQNNSFNVVRTSQYVSGYGVITKSPKNKTSTREIYFDNALKEVLLKQKDNLNELSTIIPDWKFTDRILTTNKGGPMHPIRWSNF